MSRACSPSIVRRFISSSSSGISRTRPVAAAATFGNPSAGSDSTIDNAAYPVDRSVFSRRGVGPATTAAAGGGYKTGGGAWTVAQRGEFYSSRTSSWPFTLLS